MHMDIAISVTSWILFISVVASFIISLIHRKKRDLFPIQLYIIVSLIVNGVLNIIDLIREPIGFLKEL